MIVYGILLTFVAYYISRKIYAKIKLSLLNPILIAIIILVLVMRLQGIDYDVYNQGGKYISDLLGLLVVLLALPLYKNKDKIKAHFWPIIAGINVGIVVSFLTVVTFSRLLDLDFMKSLYGKSITTPLALEVTNMVGGTPGITIISVIITGILGATLAPSVMKFGRIQNDTAKGIGIGCASHGIGTAKAIEMGDEVAGASGLAMGLSGILTVLFASVFFVS